MTAAVLALAIISACLSTFVLGVVVGLRLAPAPYYLPPVKKGPAADHPDTPRASETQTPDMRHRWADTDDGQVLVAEVEVPGKGWVPCETQPGVVRRGDSLIKV